MFPRTFTLTLTIFTYSWVDLGFLTYYFINNVYEWWGVGERGVRGGDKEYKRVTEIARLG